MGSNTADRFERSRRTLEPRSTLDPRSALDVIR